MDSSRVDYKYLLLTLSLNENKAYLDQMLSLLCL